MSVKGTFLVYLYILTLKIYHIIEVQQITFKIKDTNCRMSVEYPAFKATSWYQNLAPFHGNSVVQ